MMTELNENLSPGLLRRVTAINYVPSGVYPAHTTYVYWGSRGRGPRMKQVDTTHRQLIVGYVIKTTKL